MFINRKKLQLQMNEHYVARISAYFATVEGEVCPKLEVFVK